MLTGRGATARRQLGSGCPGGNSYKAKMFAKSPLGPSRTNKVLFERTLFVAAVRRSLLCLDSPQVKFSAERVASGRPRLRGPQRQKPRKNESAGSWDSRCAAAYLSCRQDANSGRSRCADKLCGERARPADKVPIMPERRILFSEPNLRS